MLSLANLRTLEEPLIVIITRCKWDFYSAPFLFSLQIYRILGRTVVTYPKLLDETDFYMALDMSLLIDEIKVKLRQTTTNNFKWNKTILAMIS